MENTLYFIRHGDEVPVNRIKNMSRGERATLKVESFSEDPHGERISNYQDKVVGTLAAIGVPYKQTYVCGGSNHNGLTIKLVLIK